eukprot:scaffold5876_cov143-Amphora_coffeaeformis.AAC.1
MGRGQMVGGNSGNLNFRRVCWEHKEEYLLADRDEKQTIARKVLAQIGSLDPPGRVIHKSDDQEGFFVVNQKRAIEKTCQLLREKKVKKPDGMPSLPSKLMSVKSRKIPQRVQSMRIKASRNKDEDGDYEGKPKVVKAKTTAKHKKIALPIAKKKAAPKAKKTTKSKSESKTIPHTIKPGAAKIVSSEVAKAKVAKAKKTFFKSKKAVNVSTPGKNTDRPKTTSDRKTPRVGIRRSMRNVISKSLKEASTSTDEDKQIDSPKAVAIALVTPTVVQSTKPTITPNCDTVVSQKDEYQVPRQQVMAFEEEPEGDAVDSKKDRKP